MLQSVARIISSTSIGEAVRLHRAGLLTEAAGVYLQILDAEPTRADALNLLGVVRQQEGRHEDALDLIGRAIRIASSKAPYHNNYGAALISLKRFPEADTSFRRALTIRPNYADALANLGMAQAALGDEVGAEKSFRLALQCQACHRDAITRLASLMERQCRAEEAVRLLETAIAASPCPHFHLALGNLRRAAGNYQEAAEHYRFAIMTDVTPRFQDGAGTPDLLRYDGTHAGQVGNVPSDSRRIAFISPHCVLDFSNGAATATRHGLRTLARLGFKCEAFCGLQFDAAEKMPIEAVLRQHNEPFLVHNAQIGPFQGRMIFTEDSDTLVTIVDTTPTRDGWLNREEIAAFLTGCELFLDRTRPDLVWTYGGDPVSLVVQRLAKQRGIPVVFALHNFSYTELSAFDAADCITVPSEFSRQFYRERLGLDCRVLPNIVNWEAAEVRERNPRYLTFINPHVDKGVYIFARIARELARRRPDIPILVTLGRSRADALTNPALGLSSHLLGQFPNAATCDGRNILVMPALPPQQFRSAVYSITKLLLMPSLCDESFGLVAAEAMLNGIPVLASNRGALPETIGDTGFLLDIPAKYMPETQELPSAEEMEPWVETIIRLWDDAAEYDHWSQAARDRAQRWHPDRLAPLYREFFSNVCHQSRAPFATH